MKHGSTAEQLHETEKDGSTAGLSADRIYLREIGKHQVMSHEDQRELGMIITTHRETVKLLTDTLMMTIEELGQDLSLIDMAPLRLIVDDIGFSVVDLQKAGQCLQAIRPHVPCTMQNTIDTVYEQFTSITEEYAHAVAQLVNGNLKLVPSIVREYRRSPVPVEDLLQEANIGLMRAAERYNPRHQTKFITYSVHWIRQALQRATSTSYTMRLPSDVLEEYQQYQRARTRLERQHERSVTIREIAEELKWSLEKAKRIEQAASRPLSLDEPFTDDADSATLTDQLAARNAFDIEVDIDQRRLMSQLHEAMQTLDSNMAAIVRRYYGFLGYEPHTLDDIAAELHMTRDKVRRQLTKATMLLRRALDKAGVTPDMLDIFNPA